jgi:hypothetical protein
MRLGFSVGLRWTVFGIAAVVALSNNASKATGSDTGYWTLDYKGSLHHVQGTPTDQVAAHEWQMWLYSGAGSPPTSRGHWGTISHKTLADTMLDLKASQAFETRYCRFFHKRPCPPDEPFTAFHPFGPVAVVESPPPSVNALLQSAFDLSDRVRVIKGAAGTTSLAPSANVRSFFKRLRETSNRVAKLEKGLWSFNGRRMSELSLDLDSVTRRVDGDAVAYTTLMKGPTNAVPSHPTTVVRSLNSTAPPLAQTGSTAPPLAQIGRWEARGKVEAFVTTETLDLSAGQLHYINDWDNIIEHYHNIDRIDAAVSDVVEVSFRTSGPYFECVVSLRSYTTRYGKKRYYPGGDLSRSVQEPREFDISDQVNGIFVHFSSAADARRCVNDLATSLHIRPTER